MFRLALALAVLSAADATQCVRNFTSLLLPSTVIPTHYDLFLALPDPNQGPWPLTFSGMHHRIFSD